MPADPLAWLVSLEGVPSAYAAAREGIDVRLRDRGRRRTGPELTAESLLRGAPASAALEGSAASLDEVREGAGTRPPRLRCGCRWSCPSLVPVVNRAPLQALARMHTLACADARRPSAGRETTVRNGAA